MNAVGAKVILIKQQYLQNQPRKRGISMIKHLQDTVTLNNNVKMPGFGFGVYKVEDGETVVEAVKAALKAGYRMIDTAAVYKNEAGVGQAI